MVKTTRRVPSLGQFYGRCDVFLGCTRKAASMLGAMDSREAIPFTGRPVDSDDYFPVDLNEDVRWLVHCAILLTNLR